MLPSVVAVTCTKVPPLSLRAFCCLLGLLSCCLSLSILICWRDQQLFLPSHSLGLKKAQACLPARHMCSNVLKWPLLQVPPCLKIIWWHKQVQSLDVMQHVTQKVLKGVNKNGTFHLFLPRSSSVLPGAVGSKSSQDRDDTQQWSVGSLLAGGCGAALMNPSCFILGLMGQLFCACVCTVLRKQQDRRGGMAESYSWSR